MNTINIDDTSLRDLKNLSDYTYIYYYKNIKKILKILSSDNYEDKRYVLDELYKNRDNIPDEIVIPDHYVKIGDDKGYMFDYVEGNTLFYVLYNRYISFEEKKYYIKKVGYLLDKLDSYKGLHINDLHEGNIIVNLYTKLIKVIDIDSIKIGNSISFPAQYLRKNSLLNYSNKYHIVNDSYEYVRADRNTDIYCYIMMILNYITNDLVDIMNKNEYYELLYKLSICGISNDLLDCFSRLIESDDNINPVEYIDSLEEEQILKARYLIWYKL